MALSSASHRAAKPARLIVRTLKASATHGHVAYGPLRWPCALGRSGVRAIKSEGDGATPRGRFPLRHILFGPAASRYVQTALPKRAIRRRDGWCDAPLDRNYNRLVRLPYPASAECLWRSDGLYDVVTVLGYNDRPRVRDRGSAIFMHIARDRFEPTEGCVALARDDLRRLLSRIRRRTELIIKI